MLFEATGALAAISACLSLWQWGAALRFPLHRRKPLSRDLPPVTLLKPLNGCDDETRGCLESWFAQDYPDFEILFGVASNDDPVCQVVRDLQAKYPRIHSKLVVCNLSAGPNRKAAKLAVLETLARRQFIVVSDADVRAPADFLQQTVPSLLHEKTGLVNCFYFLANPSNIAMRWEALAVNADFWSYVLQSKSLKPMDFGLGAVMAVRRNFLVRVGGFRRLASFLADDYHLGSQIARAGGKIEITPLVVECRDAQLSFKQVWHHQLRWARTIRVCQPLPFFFSILGNATLWPVIWLAANPKPWVLLATSLLILMRVLMAGHLQSRLTQKNEHWRYAWLAPVKDLLHFLLWAASFGGNHVSWRGQTFRVTKAGRLIHRPAAAATLQEASAS